MLRKRGTNPKQVVHVTADGALATMGKEREAFCTQFIQGFCLLQSEMKALHLFDWCDAHWGGCTIVECNYLLYLLLKYMSLFIYFFNWIILMGFFGVTSPV